MAWPNKSIMVGILLAGKALLKSPYVKRYKAKMFRITLLLLISFSFQVLAGDECEKVVSGYETKDTMYVVCDSLTGITLEQANQKLKSIFEQYKGEPDEIIVYFVSSQKLVGKSDTELQPEDFVGFYYTHNSVLIIWPNIESRKKEMYLKWW
jgi:hypothetical protein